jgi:predicted phage terminase large subunit-like protein
MIIDDLIKNAMEARNANVLNNHWEWFTNTMISRMEEGAKTIIIMTRWATDDLAGKALRHYQEEGKKIKHICMKALQDNGTMLCDAVLSKKSYESKKRALGTDIAEANYQQEPIDVVGKLYSSFKTYKEIPVDKETKKPLFTRIFAYVDTADTGKDYLCMLICGEYNKEVYVLDVYYTKAPMETTETETAKRLHDHNVGVADIESNNGGRGFARNVERILRNKFNSNRTRIKWFHQSQNKMARILSNATWVMDHIYFPNNWMDKWPAYYKAMNTYQREGKNEHDDAPDTTTGIAEKMNKQKWLY